MSWFNLFGSRFKTIATLENRLKSARLSLEMARHEIEYLERENDRKNDLLDDSYEQINSLRAELFEAKNMLG